VLASTERVDFELLGKKLKEIGEKRETIYPHWWWHPAKEITFMCRWKEQAAFVLGEKKKGEVQKGEGGEEVASSLGRRRGGKKKRSTPARRGKESCGSRECAGRKKSKSLKGQDGRRPVLQFERKRKNSRRASEKKHRGWGDEKKGRGRFSPDREKKNSLHL